MFTKVKVNSVLLVKSSLYVDCIQCFVHMIESFLACVYWLIQKIMENGIMNISEENCNYIIFPHY